MSSRRKERSHQEIDNDWGFAVRFPSFELDYDCQDCEMARMTRIRYCENADLCGFFYSLRYFFCHLDVRRDHTRRSTKIGDMLYGVSSIISFCVEMINDTY